MQRKTRIGERRTAAGQCRGRISLRGTLLASCVVLMAGCNVQQRQETRQREQVESRRYIVEAEEARETGNTEEALALLALAIEKNPTLTVAHMSMGEIYQESGDYVKAEQSYSTAARLEPRNFDAQYNHGLMLHMLNRLADAVRAYLRALSIRPEDFEANLNLATAYLQLNEPSQALTYARNATRIEPESGPAHANLGAVYSALDRHEMAVMEYQAAAELMDLSAALLLNLAESLGKIQRYEEMANTLTAAMRLEETAAMYERLGYAQFKMRQYVQSVESFRASLEFDPNHYPALNGLGVCLMNQFLLSGREDEAARREALELFRRSLRINERQPRIVELLARYG